MKVKKVTLGDYNLLTSTCTRYPAPSGIKTPQQALTDIKKTKKRKRPVSVHSSPKKSAQITDLSHWIQL